MKKQIKYIVLAIVAVSPFVTFAAGPLSGLRDLIKAVGGLINLLIPIVFGLAMIYFFWGGAQFILNSGEEKTRNEGKQKMLWGIIVLFVMFSIYGIIRTIGDSIGIRVQTGVPTGQDIPLINPLNPPANQASV